jgi:hypothetical protein
MLCCLPAGNELSGTLPPLIASPRLSYMSLDRNQFSGNLSHIAPLWMLFLTDCLRVRSFQAASLHWTA